MPRPKLEVQEGGPPCVIGVGSETRGRCEEFGVEIDHCDRRSQPRTEHGTEQGTRTLNPT
jgi:hypothetical protein